MYRRLSEESWIKHSDFLLLDVICLQLCFLAAYLFRHGWSNPYASELYRNYAIVTFLCQILTIFIGKSFHRILKRGYYQEFKATVKHTIIILSLTLLYLFATQEGGDYSRITFFLTDILYLAAGYGVSLLWKKYLRFRGVSGQRSSLVVITTMGIVDEVIACLHTEGYQSYRVTGLVIMDVDAVGTEIRGIPVIGSRESTAQDLCARWIDEIFVRLPDNWSMPEYLIEAFSNMGITVHLGLARLAGVSGGEGQRSFVEQLGDYTVITNTVKAISSEETICKRMLDILGGLVGCVITGILFLFVAPLIYIQSPGPIFFSQTRIGKGGKKFKMYKFRSMYMDAEERKKELMEQNKIQDGLMFKMDYDPRIIGSEKTRKNGKPGGIGNFIRRTSIDEFPQFFNVLKGDMSLVGTRPPTVDEWEQYDLHHRLRMAIKPGITGLWQISGRSNIVDFEEVVRLDAEYIKNWSIDQDIKILAKTVFVVLRNEGAA